MGAQGLNFNDLLISFGHPFFIKCGDPPKPLKLQQVWCKNITFTISGISFWHLKSTDNSCFFMMQDLLNAILRCLTQDIFNANVLMRCSMRDVLN